MKCPLLIYGLRNNFILGLILIFSIQINAQRKKLQSANIDTLSTSVLVIGDMDVFDELTDTVAIGDIFNELVLKFLVINDLSIVDTIFDEETWEKNLFIRKIPEGLKPGQFTLYGPNKYLFLFDGTNLVRLPIYVNNITDLKTIRLEPLASPPQNFQIGTIYLNTQDKRLYYYNGTKWKKL